MMADQDYFEDSAPQVHVKRQPMLPPPKYDFLAEIDRIHTWYLGAEFGGSLGGAPELLQELISNYRKLCGAQADLAREVGNLKYIADAMELARKRKMAAMKIMLLQSQKISIQAAGDKARMMNKQNEQNAAASAANYTESVKLFDSVERILAAMNADIRRLEKEMQAAGVTPDKWKPLIDRLEAVETRAEEFKALADFIYSKLKSNGK